MIKNNIRKNIFANYLGQIYVILTSTLITPFYLQYMGPEGYGLIGFFVLVQIWLNLLDVGLSPTLSRQVAFARGQPNGFNDFQKLLKSFESIFFILSISLVIAVYFFSPWISEQWIQSETLDTGVISYCIVIMGLIIGLRWFITLYKSGLNGFEDQVWLNKITIVITTLRYIGALLYLALMSADIQDFFKYQLLISILELVILTYRFYFILHQSTTQTYLLAFDWQVLKNILPFSISIAYTTILWTFLMQMDKLILSGLLSLKNFGYFSIVTLIASGIIALSTPIFLAIVPRMTKLASENKFDEVVAMYRTMTQVITWIVLSFSIIISIFSQEIIYILSGDADAALWGKETLLWFTLGYCAYVLGTYQYYLQNVLGNLNLYLKGLTISAFIYIPFMYYATTKYEAIGAAISWFIFSIVWFSVFTTIVHKKLLSGFHLKWVLYDLLPLIIPALFIGYFIYANIEIHMNHSRIALLVQISGIGFLFLSVLSLGVKSIREKLKYYYIKYKEE